MSSSCCIQVTLFLYCALLSFRASIMEDLSGLLESSPIHAPLNASAPNVADPALETQAGEEDTALEAALVPTSIWAQPVEDSGGLLEPLCDPLRLFGQHAPGTLSTEETSEILGLQGQGLAENNSTKQECENLVDTAAQPTNTSLCEHDLSLDEEVPYLLGFVPMSSDNLWTTSYSVSSHQLTNVCMYPRCYSPLLWQNVALARRLKGICLTRFLPSFSFYMRISRIAS